MCLMSILFHEVQHINALQLILIMPSTLVASTLKRARNSVLSVLCMLRWAMHKISGAFPRKPNNLWHTQAHVAKTHSCSPSWDCLDLSPPRDTFCSERFRLPEIRPPLRLDPTAASFAPDAGLLILVRDPVFDVIEGFLEKDWGTKT